MGELCSKPKLGSQGSLDALMHITYGSLLSRMFSGVGRFGAAQPMISRRTFARTVKSGWLIEDTATTCSGCRSQDRLGWEYLRIVTYQPPITETPKYSAQSHLHQLTCLGKPGTSSC
jgi:hypothetical protein